MSSEVILPTSRADAIAAFGDGAGVAVLGGGTILMPALSSGQETPRRVLLLGGAGLAGIERGDGVVRIGATTPVAALLDGDEPLASAARHVADPEIRAQATVGGNVCAKPGDVPRGDLQAPLVALGARVRSIGGDGERVEPIESFLEGDGSRLLLELEYDDVARRSGHAAVHRPHAHHFTILCASATRGPAGVRVAVAGAGPHALRAASVEQALEAGQPAPIAAVRVLDDLEPSDDALASAWYRRRVLPTVVARALAELEKEST